MLKKKQQVGYEKGSRRLLIKIRLKPELFHEFRDSIPSGGRNKVFNLLIRAYLDGRVNLEGLE